MRMLDVKERRGSTASSMATAHVSFAEMTASTVAIAGDVVRDGEPLDPQRVWGVLMPDEKPGGRGGRSVAVGVLDMAVWDLVENVPGEPLHRLHATLAEQAPVLRQTLMGASSRG